MYYIGDRFKFLGAFTAVLFAITMPFTQSSLHSNNIAVAVSNAFGTPKLAVGIAIAVILAAVIFGGAKRIGRVAGVGSSCYGRRIHWRCAGDHLCTYNGSS